MTLPIDRIASRPGGHSNALRRSRARESGIASDRASLGHPRLGFVLAWPSQGFSASALSIYRGALSTGRAATIETGDCTPAPVDLRLQGPGLKPNKVCLLFEIRGFVRKVPRINRRSDFATHKFRCRIRLGFVIEAA